MEQADDSLTTDALPTAPRPTVTEHVTGNSDTDQQTNKRGQNEGSLSTEDFDEIPMPHPDWQFNIFLDEIAQGLTDEEFKQTKYLFRGTIGDKTLKEMENIRDLFEIMRSRKFISRDNLVYLQAVLQKAGRIDLVKHAVEYANTIGNVIHFYPASSLPENGYKYVKVHVEGRDFRSCTRTYVQHIRDRVAEVLFIPKEFVIIAGIEPSCSLLITLMIPELYVAILEEILLNCEYTTEFKELGIDKVEIGNIYTVGEFEVVDREDTDQQRKLASVYQQLEKKEQQLENSEIERLRLSGDLEKSKQKVAELEHSLFEVKVTSATMKKMFVTATEESVPASLASQSALKEFQVALNQAKSENKSVIQRLISANTAVVANRIRESHRITQQRLQLEVEELKSQLMPWMLEVHKHRFFSEINSEEMDKILLESFKKLLQSFEVTLEVHILEEGLQILKKISRLLRSQDKEKLSKKYIWTQGDDLKKAMDEDQSFFLAGILHKEINEKKQIVDMVQFISQCLKEIGRTDLVHKFQELMKGTERNTAKPKRKRNTQAKCRPGAALKTDAKENKEAYEDQNALLEKVAGQVQKIYDAILTPKASFAQEFSATKDLRFACDPPPYSKHPYRI